MLVSSIVTEIKILLIDQILDHFMHHSVILHTHDVCGRKRCSDTHRSFVSNLSREILQHVAEVLAILNETVNPSKIRKES
jgi:signal transduction histidine kinase